MHLHRGAWRVTWNESGKKKERKFKDAAKAKLFELQLKMGLLKPSEIKAAPTFECFAKDYLTKYSKADKVDSTRCEDKSVLNRHLIPSLGNIKLTDLRKSHLLDLRTKLASEPSCRGKPMAPKRINNILSLAKRMMNVALAHEFIDANPFITVKPLRVPTPRFDFWTSVERDGFIDKAYILNPSLTDLVAIACHTGLRKGELRALERRHLDFERRKIRVEQSYSDKSKKIQPTKNKDTADLPMNSVVYEILKEKKDLPPKARIFEERLFHNLRRSFRDLCDMSGARKIRWHDLRHTFASTLAMAGVALATIQVLMRHKSIEMTMRYAHLSPDHLSNQTEVLVLNGGQMEGKRNSRKRRKAKYLKLWRTLSDSNARPSGSKDELVHLSSKSA